MRFILKTEVLVFLLFNFLGADCDPYTRNGLHKFSFSLDPKFYVCVI